MKKLTKNNSGQLAVGVAFGFVCILAMFGLVFNASLNTRDKMKLQTTTDYATMIASNTQKLNLNIIRQQNLNIEREWGILQPLLNIPYCATVISSCMSEYDCVEAQVETFIAANLATPEEVTSQGGDPCDQACDRYDNKIKSMEIQTYRGFQSEYFSNIRELLTKTNPAAYDIALDTMMDPRNLPSGLFAKLQKMLGAGFTKNDVRNLYESGQLFPTPDKDFGYFIQANSQDPLFEAQLETKVMLHYNYTYTYIPPTEVSPAMCHYYGTPGIPGEVILPYRVYRNSDYTTQFFTKATYLAPDNFIEKMLKLGVKYPDSRQENFGEDIEGSDGKKVQLFSQRFPIFQAVAGAKPFGGAFPESGTIGWGGTSGEDFTGAKLFGLADRDEIGGQRIDRLDDGIARVDNSGNESALIPYYVEDFLH